MKTLTINNFLTIKSATLAIRPITILIGPQASGKSIIAKLLYMIHDNCYGEMFESIKNNKSFVDYEKNVRNKFLKIFPEYTWHGKPFTIEYIDETHSITISNTKRVKHYALTFKFSENLISFYNDLKIHYKKEFDNAKKVKDKEDTFNLFTKQEVFSKSMIFVQRKYHFDLGYNQRNIFIPAGRAFFSILRKQVFSFLSENIEFDPFLKGFGVAIETIKNINMYYKKEINKKIDELQKHILSGKYVYYKNEDWIEDDRGKTKLVNSSSGQQEALPMLLVLSSPHYYRSKFKTRFFIEEPEAHLYPYAQKKIIELIGLTYNLSGKENSFFITTHSPYILTSINNLLLTSRAMTIVPDNELIAQYKDKALAFDNVSAYALILGKTNDILDRDSQIIDATYIDQVSKEIEDETDSLLKVIYETKDK